MKNLRINKRGIASLFLALGMTLCNHSGLANDARIVKVTGNKVNVRLTPTTNNKDNIVGRVNSGDTFSLINHDGGWYLIDYYGKEAYICDSYGMEMTTNNQNIMETNMAKITKNNVNIRSSANMNSNDNVIGFADITDYFKIIDHVDGWYMIDYLGQRGYVYDKYVTEKPVNQEDTLTQKMVYLTSDAILYSNTNGSYMTVLPQYQYLSVIKEEYGYYKVRVDGVIGYVDSRNTKRLTNTFIVSDLGRQMVKVFKNNQEVYRAHIISGRKTMQTDIGAYKIGHKLKNYQLTPTNFVQYWMQYNGNEGFHDASWQKNSYFKEVAQKAYDRFGTGRAVTYPASHGSHGCDNLKLEDAIEIYDIINVGDDVLVMQPNDLVKDHLISKLDENKRQEKVKKLVYF